MPTRNQTTVSVYSVPTDWRVRTFLTRHHQDAPGDEVVKFVVCLHSNDNDNDNNDNDNGCWPLEIIFSFKNA